MEGLCPEPYNYWDYPYIFSEYLPSVRISLPAPQNDWWWQPFLSFSLWLNSLLISNIIAFFNKLHFWKNQASDMIGRKAPQAILTLLVAAWVVFLEYIDAETIIDFTWWNRAIFIVVFYKGRSRAEETVCSGYNAYCQMLCNFYCYFGIFNVMPFWGDIWTLKL